MRSEIYTACGLLLIALGVPSNAQSEAEATLAVEAGAPLTVECRVRVEQRADWRLDGGAVPGDMRAGGEAPAPGGALAARLWTPTARAHHAGRYTCSADPRAAAVRVSVLPAPSPRPSPNDGGDADMMLLDYDVGRPFSVNCSQLLGKGPISWSKNGTAVEKVSDLSGRYKLQDDDSVFALEGRSHEQDYGNYSCAAGDESLVWQVQGRPYMRLPRNTNVVEGQKLKITCKVLGLPHASVEWTVERDGVNVSAAAALGERVKLAGAELELSAAQTADGGNYYCAPGERAGMPVNGTAAVTTVRVKDMYAALWPFLGICAEVFVLCAIILVYEKRRTKPELDDSDTDNHDQKKS